MILKRLKLLVEIYNKENLEEEESRYKVNIYK